MLNRKRLLDGSLFFCCRYVCMLCTRRCFYLKHSLSQKHLCYKHLFLSNPYLTRTLCCFDEADAPPPSMWWSRDGFDRAPTMQKKRQRIEHAEDLLTSFALDTLSRPFRRDSKRFKYRIILGYTIIIYYIIYKKIHTHIHTILIFIPFHTSS